MNENKSDRERDAKRETLNYKKHCELVMPVGERRIERVRSVI